MNYWEETKVEPMIRKRERNLRNRKLSHKYRCPVCYKTFQNNSGPIKKHIAAHTEEEVKKWVCK